MPNARCAHTHWNVFVNDSPPCKCRNIYNWMRAQIYYINMGADRLWQTKRGKGNCMQTRWKEEWKQTITVFRLATVTMWTAYSSTHWYATPVALNWFSLHPSRTQSQRKSIFTLAHLMWHGVKYMYILLDHVRQFACINLTMKFNVSMYR